LLRRLLSPRNQREIGFSAWRATCSELRVSHRALVILFLHCLACANALEAPESDSETAHHEPMGSFGGTPPVTEPPLEVPLCGPFPYPCVSEFTVTFEASEPWPVGRYFLRVSLNHGPPTVCEIAFEPIVGAVTDTCDDEERGFRVSYRYDNETRAIEKVTFGGVLRVDMEILIAEDLPPVVEAHHDVVVQKCSYICAKGEPLAVPVRVRSAAESERDAGAADAGERAPDAATDAAL
jgi:hypothetical protein